MPSFQGNVIRSLQFTSVDTKEKFLREHEVGARIKYRAYTSADKHEIHNADGDVQIYIQSISAGKDVSSINPIETEVLFLRNTEFNVICRYDQNGQTFLLLEEVTSYGNRN